MPTASFTGSDCCPGVVVPPSDTTTVLAATCCIGGSTTNITSATADFGGIIDGCGTCNTWNITSYEINYDSPCHRVVAGLEICGPNDADLELGIGSGAYVPGSVIELVVTETTLLADVVVAIFYYPIPANCEVPLTFNMILFGAYGGGNCDWTSGTCALTLMVA